MHNVVFLESIKEVTGCYAEVLQEVDGCLANYEKHKIAGSSELNGVIFMELIAFQKSEYGLKEVPVIRVEASHDGYLIAKDVYPKLSIFRLPKEMYIEVPVGPIKLFMRVEFKDFALLYLRYFEGARLISREEYLMNVEKLKERDKFCVEKKIICKDNFNTDSRDETFVATGVYCLCSPKSLVDCFNSNNSSNYYELVSESYKLRTFEI